MTRVFRALLLSLLFIGLLAPAAEAAFPYDWHYPPADLGDDERWKYSSKTACQEYGTVPSEESVNCDPLVEANPQELMGVMGASVDKAWEALKAAVAPGSSPIAPASPCDGVSSSCPVVIAVHDSGIIWDLTYKSGEYRNVNSMIWLNARELPPPGGAGTPYDRNNDGVFNIRDYCQRWETPGDCGGGDPNVSDLNANGIIDPEDLIFEYSDGFDGYGGNHENNGYVDDVAGWDAYEDDNDPFDEVHYGHGTGEAYDSSGEAENGVPKVGTCPNCMTMPIRVGDSFIGDVNDFAQGVLYATDNGASVIQSALGTLNNSRFAQEAIDYAYRRGVVLIASAADESAGHHNQPSVLEHAVTMNSVGEPQVPGQKPASYLEFRGCTNYGAYITAAVPSNSCSSEAVGRSAGMTGLLYSAARRAVHAGGSATTCGVPSLPACGFKDYGALDGTGGVTAGRGISAEEADQLIATTADDISFTEPTPYTQRPGYTAETRRYGATGGWDPFFGYGRINARRMVAAVLANRVPPEADITSPKWFEIVDPEEPVRIEGYVASRRTPKYSYEVRWAPWSWKYGDRDSWKRPAWQDVTPAGAEHRDQPLRGTLATISPEDIEAALAATNTPVGADSGPAVDPATGRGEHENMQFPDKFSVIVQVIVTAEDAAGAPVTTKYRVDIDDPPGGGDPNADQTPEVPLRGIGTKNFFFHKDPALFPDYPKDLHGDGAAPPRFVDIDDDGQNEMAVATSNGEIHMFEADGGETPGWPVTSTDMDLNYAAPAYRSGEVTVPVRAAVLRSPAVGDLDRDGDVEVVASDFMGRVLAWDADGNMLPGFPVRTDPVYSSPQRADRAAGFYASHPELVPGDFPGPLQPDAAASAHWQKVGLPNDPDLVPDLVNRRISEKIKKNFAGGINHDANRVWWGFAAAPSLGNLDGSDGLDRELEIVAGAMDRHVYAWNLDGSPVTGWEKAVMLRDPAKLDASDRIDPITHLVYDDDAADHYNAGAIINSVALGDVNRDVEGLLELAATVNEEYDEVPNTDDAAAVGLCSTLGNSANPQQAITCGNNRVYQLRRGGSSTSGGGSGAASHPDRDAYRSGWPARIATILLELLPVVGEGPDGAPVLGNTNTTPALETGIYGTAGPGYVFDANGVSVYGRNGSQDRSLLTDAVGAKSNSPDHPALPALGGAIFSAVGPGRLSFIAGTAGAGKLSDVALPEDQMLSDNHLSAWDTTQPQPGQPGPRNQLPSFPRELNDLQFLSTAASGDIDGDGIQELLEGSAYYDLHAYDWRTGNEPGLATLDPMGWPKFTGGWTVGPPTLGDFNDDGLRDVAHVIREGRLFVWNANGAKVCDPASWPEFGHDAWNTNNIETDAIRPRVTRDLSGGPNASNPPTVFLRWTAPGDDWTCGRAHGYEIRRSTNVLTNENFEQGDLIGRQTASAPGTMEGATIPCGDYYVALRTLDAARFGETPAQPVNLSAVSNNLRISSQCVAEAVEPDPDATPTPDPDPSTTSPSPSPSGSSGSPSPSPSGSPEPPGSGTLGTTIETNRSKTRFRGRFTLSGQVRERGSCSDVEVTVTKRVFGRRVVKEIGTVPADEDGTWSLTTRSWRSAAYRATAHADNCVPGRSGSVGVKVRVRVTIEESPGCRHDDIDGRVMPRYPKTRVRLEHKRHRRWKVVDRDRLDRRSRFSLTPPSCSGPYRVVWRKQSRANIRGQERVPRLERSFS